MTRINQPKPVRSLEREVHRARIEYQGAEGTERDRLWDVYQRVLTKWNHAIAESNQAVSSLFYNQRR